MSRNGDKKSKTCLNQREIRLTNTYLYRITGFQSTQTLLLLSLIWGNMLAPPWCWMNLPPQTSSQLTVSRIWLDLARNESGARGSSAGFLCHNALLPEPKPHTQTHAYKLLLLLLSLQGKQGEPQNQFHDPVWGTNPLRNPASPWPSWIFHKLHYLKCVFLVTIIPYSIAFDFSELNSSKTILPQRFNWLNMIYIIIIIFISPPVQNPHMYACWSLKNNYLSDWHWFIQLSIHTSVHASIYASVDWSE